MTEEPVTELSFPAEWKSGEPALAAPDGQWGWRTAVIQPGETVTLPATSVRVTSPAQNVTWVAVRYRPDGFGCADMELEGRIRPVDASDSVRLPVWEVASSTPELTDHERSRARFRESHALHLAAIRDAIGSTPFQPDWRSSLEDLAAALDKISERAHHPDDVDWAHDATRCLAGLWYSGEYLESMTAHLWPAPKLQASMVTLDATGKQVEQPLSGMTPGDLLHVFLPDELTAEQRAKTTAYFTAKALSGAGLDADDRRFAARYGIPLDLAP